MDSGNLYIYFFFPPLLASTLETQLLVLGSPLNTWRGSVRYTYKRGGDGRVFSFLKLGRWWLCFERSREQGAVRSHVRVTIHDPGC